MSDRHRRENAGSSPASAWARDRFAALMRGPDAGIGLAEAALLIAAEDAPLAEIEPYLLRLDDLAARVRPALAVATSLHESVDQLGAVLFADEGFRGCEQADYYDTRNSFLNAVLDRRTGIPITLSIVYIEVARRAGLRAAGIGFPGHFLAKVEGEGGDEIVVDPFIGRAISEDDCAQRLRQALGTRAPFDRGWLRAATPREILVRVLGNLKRSYIDNENWEAALACAERSLLVVPDEPIELRDRGILFQRLECHAAAAADFERFLALAPDHESAKPVQRALAGLRARTPTLH